MNWVAISIQPSEPQISEELRLMYKVLRLTIDDNLVLRDDKSIQNKETSPTLWYVTSKLLVCYIRKCSYLLV